MDFKNMIAAAGDHPKDNINDIQEKSPAASGDVPKKKSKAGRKNRGLTDLHYEEKKAYYRNMHQIKQADNFNSEIIERVAGEIVEDDNIEQFKELYKLTCYDCLERFKEDNPELCNKASWTWYKRLLLNIKENTPKIKADDLDKALAVWEVLKEFMQYIGLFITLETFELMTGIYKYQLEKLAALNPKYIDFLQKIQGDRESALLNELNYNPYTQTNKIFVAKTYGIIEKTEPKQIEVNHNIRNINDIPNFNSIDDKSN